MRRVIAEGSWILLLVIGEAMLPSVHADGIYFPQQAVKKMPAIPQQRALIIVSKGQEKLVIESMLDGEGQSFGWIIPVPVLPTEIGRSTPGVLATLSRNLQPEIRHDLWPELGIWLKLGLWVLLSLLLMFSGREKTLRQLLTEILAVAIFLFLVFGMLLATLGRASAPQPGRGVLVHAETIVGNYEVTTLSAMDVDALNTWLSANGFQSLPQEGEAIVKGYIAEGWHFVAAKLQRDDDKPATPHPIVLTLPTTTPVYPMRLTALTGTPVYLELFVVADSRMAVDNPRLTLEFSDCFAKCQEEYGRYQLHRWDERKGVLLLPQTFKRMGRRQLALGHPELVELIPDGSFISKFTGSLTPEDMTTDISLRRSSGDPWRKVYYSRQGAGHRGLGTGLGLGYLSLLVLIIWRWQEFRAYGGVYGVTRIILPAIAVGVVAGVVHFLAVDKVEVTAVGHVWKEASEISAGYAACLEAVLNKKMINCDSTREEVEQQMTLELAHHNLPRGGLNDRFRNEDSPYNWIVLEDERGVVFRWFDANGIPTDVRIREAGKPKP